MSLRVDAAHAMIGPCGIPRNGCGNAAAIETTRTIVGEREEQVLPNVRRSRPDDTAKITFEQSYPSVFSPSLWKRVAANLLLSVKYYRTEIT